MHAERVKKKRINWSAPEKIDRLRAAVEDWDNKGGEWQRGPISFTA